MTRWWLVAVAVSTMVGVASASPTLAAGDFFSCAVDGAGHVACWGYNHEGELGDGTVTQRASPVRVVGLADAIQVVTGNDHACALRKGGTVVCWGDNQHGQLGDGTTAAHRTPAAVADLRDAIAIAAGGQHACALRKDGSVACWGNNDAGQLGDNSRTTRTRPVAVPALAKVVELAAGGADTCARGASGAVSCWGLASRGETGIAPSSDRMDSFDVVVGQWDGPAGGGDMHDDVFAQTHPIPIAGLADAIAIAVGSDSSCAVRKTGVATCWGTGYGNLFGKRVTAAPGVLYDIANLHDATSIAVGSRYACARASDGTAWCWGEMTGTVMIGKDVALTSVERDPSPLTGVTDATDVAVGQRHACVRRTSREVSCWGENEQDQLGTGLAVNDDIGEIPSLRAVAVAAGVAQTCAITANGHVSCWDNSDMAGKLGPIHEIAGVTDAVAITGSGRHTCVLRKTGKVACFGDDGFAPLGNGRPGPSATFVEASGLSEVVQVSAGLVSACAVRHGPTATTPGEVWCWGTNDRNWLGTGGPNPQLSPARVDGLVDPVEVTAGTDFVCAREKSGRVQCWGVNDEGQLGDGTTVDRVRPAPVRGLVDAVAIGAGSQHACAIRASREVVCWGIAHAGETGNGKELGGDDLTPVKVAGIGDAATLSVDGHSCVVRASGQVACWGENGAFQLGHGSGPSLSRPEEVATITDAVAVSASMETSCALAKDGRLTCWPALGERAKTSKRIERSAALVSVGTL